LRQAKQGNRHDAREKQSKSREKDLQGCALKILGTHVRRRHIVEAMT